MIMLEVKEVAEEMDMILDNIKTNPKVEEKEEAINFVGKFHCH